MHAWHTKVVSKERCVVVNMMRITFPICRLFFEKSRTNTAFVSFH